MTMHIETGHTITADVERVNAKRVRFVAEDGRTMFEVTANDDGKSIEVRGVETTKICGVIYSNRLLILPNVSNSITVTVAAYDEQ